MWLFIHNEIPAVSRSQRYGRCVAPAPPHALSQGPGRPRRTFLKPLPSHGWAVPGAAVPATSAPRVAVKTQLSGQLSVGGFVSLSLEILLKSKFCLMTAMREGRGGRGRGRSSCWGASLALVSEDPSRL